MYALSDWPVRLLIYHNKVVHSFVVEETSIDVTERGWSVGLKCRVVCLVVKVLCGCSDHSWLDYGA